jgi:transposase
MSAIASGWLRSRALVCSKRHINQLEDELRGIDAYVIEAMRPYQQRWEILQIIPGIDALSAALLRVEIGVDMQRFGSMKQLSSWGGMCPGNHESAGKNKEHAYAQGEPNPTPGSM